MNHLSVTFFLQMACILLACRVVGRLGRYLGQPQVVGEMIAGVLLGPSLLGLLAPGVQGYLFPKESLQILFVGAQLGVGLYMFVVGLEFDTGLFRARIRGAVTVSVMGMVAPFLLGGLVALWLVTQPGYFAATASGTEAFLFLGAAMAITAFPMLARIIHERGLAGTSLGTLALAAGAIDDAAAWCVLAIVLASFAGGASTAALAIGGGTLYVLLMLTVGRRLLRRLDRLVERQNGVSFHLLGIVLMLFCLAAFAMDAIGIHAVFGGFVLGVCMPRGRLCQELRQHLEPLVVVFLLPMFFTFSGLNTRLDLVDSFAMVSVALLLLGVACLAKGGACWAAARWNGEDNRTALAIGSLMNARGLMELIILNIGLQHGVIEPALFSMMVLMAIVTTLMASPVFEWVYGRHHRDRRGVLPGLATPGPGTRLPAATSDVEHSA